MAFLDSVRTQVREVQYKRLAVSALLLVPYVVGWLVGKGSNVLTLILYASGWVAGKASLGGRYALVALRMGWQDARGDGKAGGSWAS